MPSKDRRQALQGDEGRLETETTSRGVSSLVRILELAGCGVIVLARDGLVASMNLIAEALTGYAFATVRPDSIQWLSFKVGNGPYPLESQLARVWRGETLRLPSDSTVIVSANGDERPVEVTLSPLSDVRDFSAIIILLRDVHHQQSLDLALRASEEKYREMYENHPDMCVTVDATSERIVDCNQTLAQELGRSKEQLVGLTLDELYHPEGRANRDEARAQFRKVGALCDQERILQRADGSKLDVSLSVSKLIGSDGRLYGKGVWRNISARKQAERDQHFLAQLADVLRETAEPEQLLFEVTTRLGRYLEVPHAWFAEVDDKQEQLFVHPGHCAAGQTAWGDRECDVRLKATFGGNPEGTTTIVSDTESDARFDKFREDAARIAGRSLVASPLLRGQRWIASLVVVDDRPRNWLEREVLLVQAVAERSWLWVERLRLAATLRASQVAELARRNDVRLRTLLDAVADYAILQLDPLGRITSWNRGASLISGHRETLALGQHFSIFHVPEACAAGQPEHILECAVRDGRYEEEGLRVRSDGSTFWANVLVTPLYGTKRNLEGFAKVVRDHTERRRVARALEVQRTQLAARLEERDVLLQEVHHRVNNNLQLVSSLLSMQSRRLPEGVPRAALVDCQTRIRAIAAVHERLYRSSDHARVPFSDYATELVRDVFDAALVPGYVVTLDLRIESVAMPVAKAIPCGLILNELVTNALKHAFTQRRGGCLTVSLSRLGATVILMVADDGIGLGARGSAPRHGSLGLQLVETLSRQLRAQLDIDCSHGSTFSMRFDVDAEA